MSKAKYFLGTNSARFEKTKRERPAGYDLAHHQKVQSEMNQKSKKRAQAVNLKRSVESVYENDIKNTKRTEQKKKADKTSQLGTRNQMSGRERGYNPGTPNNNIRKESAAIAHPKEFSNRTVSGSASVNRKRALEANKTGSKAVKKSRLEAAARDLPALGNGIDTLMKVRTNSIKKQAKVRNTATAGNGQRVPATRRTK